MPVDRVRRDAAANALASFLRGEADLDALVAGLKRLGEASEAAGVESSEGDTYLKGLPCLFLYGDWHRPLTEETWLEMCRHMAFLKTDFEMIRGHGRDHEVEDRPRDILLARWHTLGLLFACGIAYLTSWWLLYAASLISSLRYNDSWWKLLMKGEDEERRKERKRWRECCPFANEAEWLAHKHRVDECHLPAFDAGAFEEPKPVMRWLAILTVSVEWTWYLTIAAMVAYSYLIVVFFWPVCMVGMSLCRRNASQQQRVAS